MKMPCKHPSSWVRFSAMAQMILDGLSQMAKANSQYRPERSEPCGNLLSPADGQARMILGAWAPGFDSENMVAGISVRWHPLVFLGSFQNLVLFHVFSWAAFKDDSISSILEYIRYFLYFLLWPLTWQSALNGHSNKKEKGMDLSQNCCYPKWLWLMLFPYFDDSRCGKWWNVETIPCEAPSSHPGKHSGSRSLRQMWTAQLKRIYWPLPFSEYGNWGKQKELLHLKDLKDLKDRIAPKFPTFASWSMLIIANLRICMFGPTNNESHCFTSRVYNIYLSGRGVGRPTDLPDVWGFRKEQHWNTNFF